MRKMATVRKIDDIQQIENADAIEKAVVGGWNVVVKKGEYEAGDFAVYCEIDSWVSKELAPFLFEGKSYNGIEGARLKTKKLRGVVSQGLLLPLSVLEGKDVSDVLGIVKWDNENLQNTSNGPPKGNFPSFIPKTDQERVQNLKQEIESKKGGEFEVTIKLDGSSITMYHYNGVDGVCSRNLDLRADMPSAFWDIAREINIHEKIKSTGRNLAFQGELISPKIQSNYEKVDKPYVFIYDVFDIDKQQYLLPEERRNLCKELDVSHVPLYDPSFVLNHSIAELIYLADGEGMNKGVKREGLVFKSCTDDFSFKVISNSYLLKRG